MPMPQVDGKHIEHDGDDEVCPTEEEERGDHADVEDDHKDGGDPDEAGLALSAAHAEVGLGGGLFSLSCAMFLVVSDL